MASRRRRSQLALVAGLALRHVAGVTRTESEGGPINANLPECGPVTWAFHLGCQQDPKRYLYDASCLEARKHCRRTPNPIVCPDVSKPPAWWFMEPGWFINPPDWAVADPHVHEASFVQEEEVEGGGRPTGEPTQRREGAQAAAAAADAAKTDADADATEPAPSTARHEASREGASSSSEPPLESSPAAPRRGGGGGPAVADAADELEAQLQSQVVAMRGLLEEQEAGIETVQRGLEQAERAFARLQARVEAQPPPDANATGWTTPPEPRGIRLDGQKLLGTLLELQQLVQTVMHRYVQSPGAG